MAYLFFVELYNTVQAYPPLKLAVVMYERTPLSSPCLFSFTLSYFFTFSLKCSFLSGTDCLDLVFSSSLPPIESPVFFLLLLFALSRRSSSVFFFLPSSDCVGLFTFQALSPYLLILVRSLLLLSLSRILPRTFRFSFSQLAFIQDYWVLFDLHLNLTRSSKIILLRRLRIYSLNLYRSTFEIDSRSTGQQFFEAKTKGLD